MRSALGRERDNEDLDAPIRDPVHASAADEGRGEIDEFTWIRCTNRPCTTGHWFDKAAIPVCRLRVLKRDEWAPNERGEKLKNRRSDRDTMRHGRG